MRGCYNWFRPPRTKYEIWMEKHERNRMKRLLEEAEQEIWLGRVWNIHCILNDFFPFKIQNKQKFDFTRLFCSDRSSIVKLLGLCTKVGVALSLGMT